MIWSSLRTVVYPVSRPRTSATSRTVLGPRVQRTRRMASSASVGLRRREDMAAIIYDDFRRCQYESFRRTAAPGAWHPSLAPEADTRAWHRSLAPEPGTRDSQASRSAVSGATRLARLDGTATARIDTSASRRETAR